MHESFKVDYTDRNDLRWEFGVGFSGLATRTTITKQFMAGVINRRSRHGGEQNAAGLTTCNMRSRFKVFCGCLFEPRLICGLLKKAAEGQCDDKLRASVEAVPLRPRG